MLKFEEIAPRVWVFPGVGTGENCGVVLGERGALLVDMTSHPTDLDATQRFLAEMGGEVRALVFTRVPDEPVSRWSGVPYMTPGTPETAYHCLTLPVDGWRFHSRVTRPGGR